MYNNIYQIENYNNLNTENNINTFNSLYSCFNNFYICTIGLFFPYCLFGKIYEIAQFGDCLTGCCKLFSLQFFISLFFSVIYFIIEWNMFLSKEYTFINEIDSCNQNTICYNRYIDFNHTELINNHCKITYHNTSNTTDICKCLKNPLVNQCEYNSNLSNTLYDMMIYIYFVSFINSFILCFFTGLFLGHYRNRISQKYNILYNSRYNFLLHCCPLTNPLALCQEYNSIDVIETFRPFNPVEQKFTI